MTDMIQTGQKRMLVAEDDDALVIAAQQDPAAFRPLYQKWILPIYRYFYFKVGNIKDAEDLTSQLFLKVMEDLPRYRPKGYFAAWLFTLARSRAVDFYRREKRVTSLENLDLPVEDPDLLGNSYRREATQRLLALLRDLPEDEREIIRLRFVVDLSYREMGIVLHRSEDAVRKAVSRLVKNLHDNMEGYNVESGE